MRADLSPLQVLLVILAGWINRHQQHVIEYLIDENRVLKGQLTGRRLRLTDDQRRRLAATRRGSRGSRPAARAVGRVVGLATENSGWGYSRIQGALKNLGHGVARSTVAKVLKDNGIPAAPERPSRRMFLRAHCGEIAGADFFTREVWTPRGRIPESTLFVLDLQSRRVHVAGSTPTPDAGCMAQAARRLADAVDGWPARHRVLLGDRDAKWTEGFRRIVDGAGVRIVHTPVPAPNVNAYAELRALDPGRSVLDRPILSGERRLLRALDECVAHDHGERTHQGSATS